jgi:sugar phosphate permease
LYFGDLTGCSNHPIIKTVIADKISKNEIIRFVLRPSTKYPSNVFPKPYVILNMGFVLSYFGSVMGLLIVLWGLNGVFQSVGGPASYSTISSKISKNEIIRFVLRPSTKYPSNVFPKPYVILNANPVFVVFFVYMAMYLIRNNFKAAQPFLKEEIGLSTLHKSHN